MCEKSLGKEPRAKRLAAVQISGFPAHAPLVILTLSCRTTILSSSGMAHSAAMLLGALCWCQALSGSGTAAAT